MIVKTIPRGEFLQQFRPPPGRHVSVVAPTGGGKSTLLGQILTRQTDDQLTVIVDTKPRNLELDNQLRGQGFRRTTVFPPQLPQVRLRHERRWVVHHPHSGDPDSDRGALVDLVTNTFGWCYNNAHKYGGVRLVVDEALDLTRAGLSTHIEMILTHGRSQSCGLWVGTQRPRKVPLEVYSMATDIFLGSTPDVQDQRRYAEIGGIDPKALVEEVDNLDKYWFLYLCRSPLSGGRITP